MSPYFSPKSIVAPRRRASSIGVSKTCTGRFSKTISFTRRSTASRSSPRERLLVREVEAQLVRPHGRSRLAHVLAEHLAKRLVQEVRAGVVRHRREADAPRHTGADAVSRGKARAAEEEHLVMLEPVRVDELGASCPSRRRARSSRRPSPGRRPPDRTATRAASRGSARRRAARARRSASGRPSSRNRRTPSRSRPRARSRRPAASSLEPPARETSRWRSISTR